MQTGQHIDQLYKIVKILNFGIAALAFQIAHKWRAIDRGKDRIIATDYHRSFRISGVLGKFGRGCFTQLSCQAARKMHPLAIHITSLVFQDSQRFGVIAKLDPYFFQNGFCIMLD